MYLSDEQRSDLKTLAGREGYDRSPASRARMVLLRDEGRSTPEIADIMKTSTTTVRNWLRRYDEEGLAGLEDRVSQGMPWLVSGRDRARILALTQQTPPEETGLSRWTSRELAMYLAREEGIYVSHDFIAELWKDSGIKPHRRRNFKLSADPHFDPKMRDVVGLYHDPPEGSEVLSIDNKPGVQAIERTQPSRPAGGGHVATRTHDYVRHGTTDLFAAFNTRTGWVSAGCFSQHRTIDFLDFMGEIDKEYKDAPEVHVILDNASIHLGEDVDDWLGDHPKFVFHYTPVGCSWLNQVENWLGILQRKVLEGAVSVSVQDLVMKIYRFVGHWNRNAAPFDWNATADEIAAEVEQLHRDFEGLLANNSV
jgi:transposase